MSKSVIQDWVESKVMLTNHELRCMRYRVFRESDRLYQEVCDLDGNPVHTLELPDGISLDRSSYEVMLRYVMSDAAA
ncbi:MAG: hypothetical protein AAFX10_08945 [Pseudomonadota bacterium]